MSEKHVSEWDSQTMQAQHRWEQVCVLYVQLFLTKCVCVRLWASGGGREDRWGAMGPGRGVISALFDKTESRGTGEVAQHTHKHTHSAQPVLNYSARINKSVCVCVCVCECDVHLGPAHNLS